MERLFILILLGLGLTQGGHAQNTTKPSQTPSRPTASSDEFAWGVALGSLAILGVVVGLTASSAAATPSTYSTAP